MKQLVIVVGLVSAGLVVGLFIRRGSIGPAAIWLSAVFILACPIMMLTMIGGQGHGGYDPHHSPKGQLKDQLNHQHE